MTDLKPGPPNEDVPRWQTEVEEILEQSDRASTSYEKARAAAIATRYKAPDRARVASERASNKLGDGVWLVAAIVLGVAAWIAGLHWPLAGRILAIACIVVFVGFFVNAYQRSRRRRDEPKLWRGRDIDSGDGPPSWRHGGRNSRDDDDPFVGSRR